MRYAVIQNGLVTNVIDAPEGWSIVDKTLVPADGLQVGPGDLWDGQVFTRPASPPVTQIAPYDFLALFTAAESYAILTSADPTVVVARAKLQTIITYVDLASAETVGYCGYLEQLGLIAAGRAAQILAGAPPA